MWCFWKRERDYYGPAARVQGGTQDVFAASEIDCLDRTIKKYGQKTFGQLTDVTHDAAWKSVDQNQSISVESIARTLPNSRDLVAYLRAR